MNKKAVKKILIIIGSIASVVTILAYFNIFPFQKSKEASTQTNNIKENINSPVSANIQHQTINYFQSDTAKHIETKHINNLQNKKKIEKVDNASVTSYNQSGGITANQINIFNKEPEPRIEDIIGILDSINKEILKRYNKGESFIQVMVSDKHSIQLKKLTSKLVEDNIMQIKQNGNHSTFGSHIGCLEDKDEGDLIGYNLYFLENFRNLKSNY